MTGFLLIDKPAGITSHDVVDRIRTLTGEKRVGHAGTLDPFATGLLIVGVGREATREMHKLVGLDKTYEAVFVFGASSDTDDRTGTITSVPLPNLDEQTIRDALQKFVGVIEQIPPAYSAIKIGGKKMYEEARKGKPMKAQPRHVTIYSLSLLGSSTTEAISLLVHCSSGTYIRALARDLGHALGTAAYVDTLRRTTIGPFTIVQAHYISYLSNFSALTLIPTSDLLNQISAKL